MALERRPGPALRPAVGARVLARYFKERGIDDHARRGQWRDVRLEVNGGLNGWTAYERTVSSLLRLREADEGSGGPLGDVCDGRTESSDELTGVHAQRDAVCATAQGDRAGQALVGDHRPRLRARAA